MLQSEVDHPPEIDGSDAQRKAELVLLHAAESDSSVALCHEPGDGAFNHGSPSSVVLGKVTFAPCPTGFDELGIMRKKAKRPTGFGRCASRSEWATRASGPEHSGAAGCDCHRVSG